MLDETTTDFVTYGVYEDPRMPSVSDSTRVQSRSLFTELGRGVWLIYQGTVSLVTGSSVDWLTDWLVD